MKNQEAKNEALRVELQAMYDDAYQAAEMAYASRSEAMYHVYFGKALGISAAAAAAGIIIKTH